MVPEVFISTKFCMAISAPASVSQKVHLAIGGEAERDTDQSLSEDGLWGCLCMITDLSKNPICPKIKALESHQDVETIAENGF